MNGEGEQFSTSGAGFPEVIAASMVSSRPVLTCDPYKELLLSHFGQQMHFRPDPVETY